MEHGWTLEPSPAIDAVSSGQGRGAKMFDRVVSAVLLRVGFLNAIDGTGSLRDRCSVCEDKA